ncbi:MAG: LuxR C-terminal-related transcriptional regulator [Oscillospiraceae bacterium]|nr:LuxR C-terminal-related transcriptional regulator [Oscillospiraceae bacterium]
MDYITAAEAAEKWGVSQRQVHRLLAAGRINGVKQYGKRFLIPADATRPVDPRFEPASAPQKSLSDDLADVLEATYKPAPRDNPDALIEIVGTERLRAIPENGLAYWRGDFEQVLRRYREIEEDDAVKLCASAAAIASSICLGDYPFFQEIEAYLTGIVQRNRNSSVSAFAELALANAYTGMTAPKMVARWLKDGDLSALPDLAKPNALCMRARYFKNLKQYDSMLAVAQTALQFCASENGLFDAEISLKITCALALSELGRTEEAEPYLLDVMRSCLPHGFLTGLALHLPMAGGLIEKLVERDYPAYNADLRELADRAVPGWVIFHNRFTKENITHILTSREYQMARLAAQGVPFRKIAEQFNIALGTVNNHMQIIYQKLYIKGKKHLSEYVF